MANRYFAVVKKDNYNTTHSTGGVVVAIKHWPENASDRTSEVFNVQNNYGSDHELIACDENVKVNWIYTDKTNQFVDSNISTN